jgi:tetratricopeptide (TPR) repeat protein
VKQRIWEFAALMLSLSGLAGGARGQQQADLRVEPPDLERRADLIGREVIVDDRVKYYVERKGSEDDELELKRTSVSFRVPRRLRPADSPKTGVIVRGILKREGSRLFCEVTSLQVVPADLERLERGLAILGPRDYATRKAWARWAERRASDFGEENGPLMTRAKELEAEVLRMQGDLKRVAVDAPQEWLAMAQDARQRKVAEPEPSALAHRALRAKLAAAKDIEEIKAVIAGIEAFFPAAAKDQGSARVNLSRWEEPYAKDPAEAYRDPGASAAVRGALDRRLWADAEAQLLDVELIPDLPSGITLSERAASLLPEKPDLPARLLEKTFGKFRKDLASLRLDEVKALAEAYREKLQRPEESRKVLREWLEIKRSRLSDTDAEGPVSLAKYYEDLLQDRVTAVELLRKAWKIDPTARDTEEAFRLRGFRKIKDEWVESDPGAEPGPASGRSNSARPTPTANQGLLGLTPEEVRLKLNGKPSRVNYAYSRGQRIEQWIYHLDNNSARYVNLLRAPGEMKPRVISDYTLPRISRKGAVGSAR